MGVKTKNSFGPGEWIDCVHLGADNNPPMIDHLEVTTSNTYRLYTSATKYRSVYMYKGLIYPGKGIVKVTDSGGTALTAQLVYAIY